MKLPDHLFPFQREAMYLLAAPTNKVLGLPPGSGKSVVAIAAWELLDAFNVLVLCPAIVRADWRDKVHRFAGRIYNVGREAFPGRNVVIRSYEEVNTPARRAQLLAGLSRYDVLVLDEGHRLRNPGTATSTSIYGAHASGHGLCVRARHCWPMSGTIAVNHIGDLYPHVRALAAHLLPSKHGQPLKYEEFLDYFGIVERGRWGIRVKQLRNKPLLKEIVHQFVIQCPVEVVSAQLPRLRVETVRLEEDELDWLQYQEFAASAGAQALQLAMATVEEAASMDAIWQLTDSLSAARRILGELKAPAVARYVREILESDPEARVLVFAHHKAVMQRIRADLTDLEPGARVIDGDTPELWRTTYVETFQQRGTRVLIAGIGTMREGITLTAANRVVFAEASWVPADNNQAIARAYRIGQLRPVLAEYVCIANTLDEAVTRVCARKARQLSEFL